MPGYFLQLLPKGRLGEMISFEFHLKKWHNKTPKPLWFRGFSNRYLFRFAMLVAENCFLLPQICANISHLAVPEKGLRRAFVK